MKALLRLHAAFLIVFVALGCAFFLTLRDGNDWGGDFSVYVLEARNFAEHQPFDKTSYVPTAESLLFHPAVYPPLTSLVLVPVYDVYGIDYKAFKIELTFFLWLSMPFYYVLGCRRGLSREGAAAIVLVFGLCPLLLSVNQYVGSDGLFLFLSALTLLVVDEIHRRGWNEKHAIPAAAVTAILLLLCYLTRVNGLALIGGVAAYEFLVAPRSRTFGVLTITATAIALFVYSRLAYHAGTQYGSNFVLKPAQWAANTVAVLQAPAQIWAGAPRIERYVAATAVLVLGVTGYVRRLLHPGPVEFYLTLWLAVLISYHMNDERYMLPVLPFLLMYAGEALNLAVQRIRVNRRLVLGVCGAAAVLLSVIDLRAVDTGPIREGVTQASFAEVCTFLRGQTPEGALLLSWNPRIFALYTGRKSALYPQTAPVADFERQIPSFRPVFIVLWEKDPDRRELVSYLDYAGPRAKQVFADADFRVYAVQMDGLSR